MALEIFSVEFLCYWGLFQFILIIIAIIYNFYIRRTCGVFKDNDCVKENLEGKTVLITGANGGLGKATAKYMAKRGCRIIMACRNLKTAEEAKDEIIAESQNRNVVLYGLDLSSFESIRNFAAEILEKEPRLEILIHNAAYSNTFQKSKTVDEIESTMQINLYGPFLLTHLLIDLLKTSAPSKIILVGSKAHTLSYFNLKNEKHLNPIDCWFPLSLYPNSKFACVLFIYELARRLQGTGVTANIVHPGTIDSPIWNKAPFPSSIFVNVARKFMKTTEQGIQTILYASLSKDTYGITGQYYRDCRVGKSHKGTYDEDSQKILWEEAKKIVKLTYNDPQI